MTRGDIIATYNVDERGIIRSPGKFEGEQVFAPYFWEAYLDGGADEDDGNVLTFSVTHEKQSRMHAAR